MICYMSVYLIGSKHGIFFLHLANVCQYAFHGSYGYGMDETEPLIHAFKKKKRITLPETNKSHLKMTGWNTTFLLGPILERYTKSQLLPP